MKLEKIFHILLNKKSTFTVGKPCCVLSLTEPRLPSVRYRALCWVSGCTSIFSSFPSLLTGYCPLNIGLFFTPVPFWFSNVLRSQSTTWKKHQKVLFLQKSCKIKEETEQAVTLKTIDYLNDKINKALGKKHSITKYILKFHNQI